MRAWKWIVVGVLGAGVLAGAIVTLVFWLTSGIVEAAEGFFEQVGAGRYEEAYAAAAPGFRQGQDLAAFKAVMQKHKLDQYQSASWSTRRVRNERGYLRGTVRTSAGTVPTFVMLLKSDGVWRVYSLQFHGGAQSQED